jgi:hypothetical protein
MLSPEQFDALPTDEKITHLWMKGHDVGSVAYFAQAGYDHVLNVI